MVAICNMKALAADGVSFAIPIDAAKEVVAALAAHGRVIRPYIGIKMLQREPLRCDFRILGSQGAQLFKTSDTSPGFGPLSLVLGPTSATRGCNMSLTHYFAGTLI